MGVLKDGFDIFFGAWRAIRERGVGSFCQSAAGRAKALTVEEWHVPEGAILAFGDRALLKARTKVSEKIEQLRDELAAVPRHEEDWLHFLHDQLQDARRRYNNRTKDLLVDLRKKLLDGQLIARGFRGSFCQGAPYVIISRHEWHVLELKPSNRTARNTGFIPARNTGLIQVSNRAEGGDGKGYVGLEIGKLGTKSLFHRKL